MPLRVVAQITGYVFEVIDGSTLFGPFSWENEVKASLLIKK